MSLVLLGGAYLLSKKRGKFLKTFAVKGKGIGEATYKAIANDAIISLGQSAIGSFGVNLENSFNLFGFQLRYRDILNYFLLSGGKFTKKKNAAIGVFILMLIRSGALAGGLSGFGFNPQSMTTSSAIGMGVPIS